MSVRQLAAGFLRRAVLEAAPPELVRVAFLQHVAAAQRNARAAPAAELARTGTTASAMVCIPVPLRQSFLIPTPRGLAELPPGIQFAELPIHTMTVDFITTWEGLAGLEEPWNVLAGGMPMRSWDWLATWWKYYGVAARHTPNHDAPRLADRKLHVLAVYRSGGAGATPQKKKK